MNVGEKKYHGYNKIDDGRLLFTADYTDMENLITWILTFGDKAEVLEPKEAREKIACMVQKMTAIYKENAGS